MPKVSALPVATRMTDADVLLIVQAGITKQLSNEVLEDSLKLAPLQVLQDEATDPIFYLGLAVAGALTSDALWKIKRITYTPGVLIPAIEYADSGAFDQVWNNRTSLLYYS